MADPQTIAPKSFTRSVVADFIGTVWGKLLTVLAAFTMLLGIAAEGVSLYRNWWDAKAAATHYHTISQPPVHVKLEDDK